MKVFIVGTDFSELSTEALKTAYAWSKKIPAKVVLVHVDTLTPILNTMPVSPSHYNLKVHEESYHVEEEIKERFDQQLKAANINKTDESLELQVLEGKKVERSLMEFLQLRQASLLFLGAEKHDWLNLILMGSVTDKMIQLSKIPIVAVKRPYTGFPQHLLLGCDFSEVGQRSFLFTKELAKIYKAKIHLLHVLTSNFGEYTDQSFLGDDLQKMNIGELFKMREEMAFKKIKEYARSCKEDHIDCEYEVKLSLREGIQETLLNYADEKAMDLIVLGSHSRSGPEKAFLGSVASKVLREGQRSLIIVK